MDEEGTYGVLIDNKPFCLTLELPWKDNRQDVSCIPAGEYLCNRTVRLKVGQTFEILQIPNRSDVLIHKGNNVWESRGCLLLGEQFEDSVAPNGKSIVTSVLSSGKAYSEFITRLTGQDQFKLVIKEV